jgi:hypothetical protein
VVACRRLRSGEVLNGARNLTLRGPI